MVGYRRVFGILARNLVNLRRMTDTFSSDFLSALEPWGCYTGWTIVQGGAAME